LVADSKPEDFRNTPRNFSLGYFFPVAFSKFFLISVHSLKNDIGDAPIEKNKGLGIDATRS
jgi:hypothetical protein